ncbi:MAG: hypothetical protein AB7O04_15405 [Hyphomonadaceae bacterium]
MHTRRWSISARIHDSEAPETPPDMFAAGLELAAIMVKFARDANSGFARHCDADGAQPK